jgi:hypothetical protein
VSTAARILEERFERALENAEELFMKTGKVHRAASELAARLSDAQIPYAIAGAMALAAHGYERATSDVNLLLTSDGLAKFKALNLGRGYLEKFAGSKGLRDTENGVNIDVLVAGEFPGDGRPKAANLPASLAADLDPYVRAKYDELWTAAQTRDPE